MPDGGACLGGAALVAQNLLMARIADGAPTILVALVTNSGVGLLALAILLVRRLGLSGIAEAVASASPWFVLPGLLGSFFVYAIIVGYQRIGLGGDDRDAGRQPTRHRPRCPARALARVRREQRSGVGGRRAAHYRAWLVASRPV